MIWGGKKDQASHLLDLVIYLDHDSKSVQTKAKWDDRKEKTPISDQKRWIYYRIQVY